MHVHWLTFSKTVNFRLFQTERVWRRQFQIWWKWQRVFQMFRKHWGKKEKLLIMSNFCFSHSVFKRLVLQTRKNQGLFGKGLTHYSIDTHLDASIRQLLKTLWEKEKLLVTSNFSFSNNVFYSVIYLCHHFSIFLTSYLYLLQNLKSLKLKV